MMYIETITDDQDTFRIERQKNSSKGKWYGLWIYQSDPQKELTNNEEWIISTLYYSLRDNPKEGMKEIYLPYNKEHAKILVKLIKKACKSGWFDDVINNNLEL